jgi:hypothetical protein
VISSHVGRMVMRGSGAGASLFAAGSGLIVLIGSDCTRRAHAIVAA